MNARESRWKHGGCGGSYCTFEGKRRIVTSEGFSVVEGGTKNRDPLRGSPVSGYAVARLDAIEEVSDGRRPWRPVRHHFGIASFGINAWTGKEAGERILNEHDEANEDKADGSQEELYLVYAGRATFELGDERIDAPAGTLVYARPGVKRTAFADEAGTTIIAVGGIPGEAYEPLGWEVWLPVQSLYESGAYAEAANRGRELVEAHPQYALPLYNLACCESLAGQPSEALGHLRLAIERAERFRSLAAEDSDFAPLRDDPAFKGLIHE